MLVRVFTLKFHAATERFDDEEVREFIKDKEVASIREHFFVHHATPYLTLVVTYLPHTAYEYAMRSLNEVGKMLGGWIKQQEATKESEKSKRQ